ncbi:MAG: hypothetical protein ABI591_01375 [Kofleriaceae bacterium]
MRLVSALAFMSLVGLVGCADKGDEGFFILNNTAPPVGGVSCAFTGDPAQPFIAAGAISYLAPQGYVFTPLLESRITAVLGHEAERTIHLEGANVTLQVANGGMQQQFTALFSGSLAPNSGTTNVSFELLPVSSIKALGSASQNVEVVASVSAYGTLGGGRIEGEPFQYPITIVAPDNGIVFGAKTPSQAGTPCLNDTNTPRSGNACNVFQDGVVDCCVSATGTNVCPAVPEM